MLHFDFSLSKSEGKLSEVDSLLFVLFLFTLGAGMVDWFTLRGVESFTLGGVLSLMRGRDEIFSEV